MAKVEEILKKFLALTGKEKLTYHFKIKNDMKEKINKKCLYNIKNLGQVSTPNRIVNFMLDTIGYQGETILNKHILDNSCGNGAFLKKIVKRYLQNQTQIKYQI